MIGRGLWIAALLVLAGITAQLQLDRQSARSPELGALVAEPFRGYAQTQVATRALAGDEPEVALAEARRLIERRPVPAEHLTVLATAYAKAGNSQSAVSGIEIAAMRGWRDPLVQEATARLALGSGDLPEATRRFTALMVLGQNNNELLSDLSDEIFAEPASPGVATLADIISETDRWQRAFLRRGPRVMPAPAFVEVIEAAAARDMAFDCAGLERAGRIVAREDRAAGAQLDAVIAQQCR